MKSLIYNFLVKNSIALIQVFNAIFASGILMLYLSYVLNPNDTQWTPTFWDYAYFTWDKVLFLLYFVCLIPFIKIQRVLTQIIVLACLSLIRLIWQATEIANQTFGTGVMPQFVLSIAAFLAVMYLTIPPLINSICTKSRFLRKLQ